MTIHSLFRKSVSKELIGKVTSFRRRKLTALINVLSIFQVRHNAIVAFQGRRSVNISGKRCVAILKFLGARNQEYAFEINSAEIPPLTLFL